MGDFNPRWDMILFYLQCPVYFSFSFMLQGTPPTGKTMGHAGAIISGGSGTAKEKIEVLEGVRVAVAEKIKGMI